MIAAGRIRLVLGLALAAVTAGPALGFQAWLEVKRPDGATAPTGNSHSWVQVHGFSKGMKSEASSAGSSSPAETKTATLSLGTSVVLADLMDALTRGETRELKLQFARFHGDQARVLTQIVFEGVLVSKISTDPGEGQAEPVFDLEFQYGRILWTQTYAEEPKPEAVGVGFDFADRVMIQVPDLVPLIGGFWTADGGNPPVDPSPPGEDTDGDGIPDEWESAHGLNPNDPADAHEDPDGDGFTNREEYLAGTDPRSGTSFFRATAEWLEGDASGEIRLSWSSVPGRTYTVLVARHPGGEYTAVATVPAGDGGVMTHTLSEEVGRFFRLRVSK